MLRTICRQCVSLQGGLAYPFDTGCLPLSYSSNPGVIGVSYRGWCPGFGDQFGDHPPSPFGQYNAVSPRRALVAALPATPLPRHIYTLHTYTLPATPSICTYPPCAHTLHMAPHGACHVLHCSLIPALPPGQTHTVYLRRISQGGVCWQHGGLPDESSYHGSATTARLSLVSGPALWPTPCGPRPVRCAADGMWYAYGVTHSQGRGIAGGRELLAPRPWGQASAPSTAAGDPPSTLSHFSEQHPRHPQHAPSRIGCENVIGAIDAQSSLRCR